VTHCVLDSSAALAWILPGEATAATAALLTDIANDGAMAPGLPNKATRSQNAA
jgi:predicted nucleic acid-binding protein